MTDPTDAPAGSAPPRRWPWLVLPVLLLLVAVAVGIAVARGGGDGGAGADGSGRASDDAGADATSRSSTIALGPGGRTLWVTSPDDDRVVEVDRSSLATRRQVAVPGQPQELTLHRGDLLITGSQSTDLTLGGLPGGGGAGGGDSQGSSPQVEQVPIPCGGSRSVIAVPDERPGPDRDLALVSCPTDDLVAVVDLDAAAALASWPIPGRPTGLVRSGDRVTVSTAGDGRLRTFDLADLSAALPGSPPATGEAPPTIRVAARSVRRAWVDGNRSAQQLAALDAGPHGVVGTYQVVDNATRLADGEIGRSSYGNPIDGRARLEPAIVGPCGARFADFAQPERLLSGPVALAASPATDLVWVVGQFSHSVSVVRCEPGPAKGRSDTVASFAVGDGARGIATAADGRTAYVDVGFDHQVARLRLPAGADAVGGDDPIERQDPDLAVKREVGTSHLSPLAQTGRRLFSDGTDTHLTPFGVVTCASCHPSAGDDGLTWRIETRDPETGAIHRKVRRTPAAWQIDTDVKPLHWDGAFTSSDDLALHTIQELQGGDGLLVDTEAISAYLAEAPAPPPAPTFDDGAVARGRAIFESDTAGCATCHTGDAGTDGLAHDVLAPAPVGAARLDEVVTPTLRAVRGRAPFGHDGRASDLLALLREHGDGHGSGIDLTAAERAAVIAYLRSR